MKFRKLNSRHWLFAVEEFPFVSEIWIAFLSVSLLLRLSESLEGMKLRETELDYFIHEAEW